MKYLLLLLLFISKYEICENVREYYFDYFISHTNEYFLNAALTLYSPPKTL